MFIRRIMIYLDRNTVNDICFTLNEKTTINPVFYLMEVYSNQTNSSKVLYLGTDNSANIERWNEFEVEENDVEDLQNGIISLIAGSYNYYVYESSTDNIDKSDVVSCVESGKLVVNGTITTLPSFDDPNQVYVFE